MCPSAGDLINNYNLKLTVFKIRLNAHVYTI